MTKDMISAARAYLGQREVPGPASNPWIKNLWLSLKSGAWWWRTYGDDSRLAWCGAFMARVCADCGLDYPVQYQRASSWQGWGVPVSGPRMGAVAVISRPGGGHVGLVTGMTADARYVRILAGNQGDAVGEDFFPKSRVIAWRAPVGATLPAVVLAQLGQISTSEA